MNLTREHIVFTLGIDLPLNESLNNLSEDLKKYIILEQIIYENLIDSIKKYVGEKWNKVITAITDWKDAAVILGKVIIDPKTLSNFSDQLWKNFKRNILNKLFDLLKKLKLDNYIPQIQEVVDKITNLTGWTKFLVAASLASITQYIITKLSNLSAEGLTKWIKAYFTDSIIDTITSKLTDFTTYISWLQPIIKGTEILFDVLKPIIDKFKYAFSLKINPTSQTENTMKKSELKKLIKEEIAKIQQETTLPANQPKPDPKQKLQGATLNLNLFKELAPNVSPQSIQTAVGLVKQNKNLPAVSNKVLADLMIVMIKTSDDSLLGKVFQNLKNMQAG